MMTSFPKSLTFNPSIYKIQSQLYFHELINNNIDIDAEGEPFVSENCEIGNEWACPVSNFRF